MKRAVVVAVVLVAGCGTSAPSSHQSGNAYSRAQRICKQWAKDSPRIRDAYVSVGTKPECVGLSRNYNEVRVPLRWVEATQGR